MAQNSQIFQNRIMPQITGVNPAIFAQPIQSFKPADLGDALAGEKLELERQKLAIAAEKNRIDMEEAKARVALLENNIKEKRLAENKAVIKMYSDQMDLKGNEQNDLSRSLASRKKFAERNNDWNILIADASTNTSLNTKDIAAKAAEISTKWGNDKEHARLVQGDEFMKGLRTLAARKDSGIDPTLFRELDTAYLNNTIDPLTINTNSLIVDEKYMDFADKEFKTAIRGYYIKDALVPEKDGGMIFKAVQKAVPNYQDIVDAATQMIRKNSDYMASLTNKARANQILSRGMTEITDLNSEVNRLVTEKAQNIASGIPDLDISKMTKVVQRTESYAQESKGGGGNVNNYYSDVLSPTGRKIGERSPKGNEDSDVDKVESKIDIAYNKVGRGYNINYTDKYSKEAARDINSRYPNLANAIDAAANVGEVNLSIGEYEIILNGESYPSTAVLENKKKLEKEIKTTLTTEEAVSYTEFLDNVGGVTTLRGTAANKNKLYVIPSKNYKKGMTVEDIKALPKKMEIQVKPTKISPKNPPINSNPSKPSAKSKGKLDDKY